MRQAWPSNTNLKIRLGRLKLKLKDDWDVIQADIEPIYDNQDDGGEELQEVAEETDEEGTARASYRIKTNVGLGIIGVILAAV